MKDNPLISICIPAFNSAPYIKETIDCWLNQTYQNIEIIIQDDFSTDDTFEIVRKMAEKEAKIKVFKNNVNLGIGKNWNACYEKVNGDFVVIFNADDTIQNFFLEESLRIFKADEQLDMVIHNYIKSNELDNIVDIHNKTKLFQGKTHDIINVNNEPYKRIHWNFTLIKKRSIDLLKNQYGLFYPTQVCDGMLWFEAYKQNLLAYYCPYPIGVYRDHEFNNSKIKFGEFESTFLWMLPLYSDIFLIKHPGTIFTVLNTIFRYLYKSIKNAHQPKYMVIINLLKHGY